jgi:hypothetical protein
VNLLFLQSQLPATKTHRNQHFYIESPATTKSRPLKSFNPESSQPTNTNQTDGGFGQFIADADWLLLGNKNDDCS